MAAECREAEPAAAVGEISKLGVWQDLDELFERHHCLLLNRLEQRLEGYLDRNSAGGSCRAPGDEVWDSETFGWRSSGGPHLQGLGTQLLFGTASTKHKGQDPQAGEGAVDDEAGASENAALGSPRSQAAVAQTSWNIRARGVASQTCRKLSTILDVETMKERTDSCSYRVMHHRAFEAFFGGMIITNAIFIGISTDLATRKLSHSTSLVMEWISIAFALVFTIELSLKLYVLRRRFFLDKDTWSWNMLDLFVVITSLVEAGASLALNFNPGPTIDNQSTSQFRILRIVRISRLVKVLRVVRVIRFIRALRTMVYQLMSTLKPLLWAILLLCLIIYLFAVILTQAVLIHRDEGGVMTPGIMLHWSNLPVSMGSLFKSVTNGISWGEVLAPLSQMGATPVILFVIYLSFVNFAVLNILTGVFCQNAIDSASHDQELVAQDMLANKHMYIQNMQRLFKDFDADNSGRVTITEFMSHLNDESVRAYFDSLELDTSDVSILFRLLDTADQNELELDDFVAGCMRLKGNAKGVDIAKLSYAQSAMARRLARFMEKSETTLVDIQERLAERERACGRRQASKQGARPRQDAASLRRCCLSEHAPSSPTPRLEEAEPVRCL